VKSTQAYDTLQIGIRNHSSDFTPDVSSGQASAPTSEASWSPEGYFFNDGNLGIGTDTPSAKLDVNGNIKANGDIIIGAGDYIKASNSWLRNNYSSLVLSNQGSGSMFFRPNGDGNGSGEMKLFQSGNLDVNGNIIANKYFQASLRDYKTNIKDYKKGCLSLIGSLNIVEFDYKDGGGENNIGIIADDSPDEFLSEEKDSVNLYNTLFIQAKAIQELSQKNKYLENKLSKLDELEKRLKLIEDK
jgi:hypothetical protein